MNGLLQAREENVRRLRRNKSRRFDTEPFRPPEEVSMNAAGLGAVSIESAFERVIEPAPADFDELGHVNNAVYLRWAQEIAIAHWRLVSTPEMLTGYLWVVLRHEIDYRDQILPGDAVIGRTWLGKAEGPRFERFIDIRKPGALRAAASVKSTWCLLDAETRRPRRVGADILDAFQIQHIRV